MTIAAKDPLSGMGGKRAFARPGNPWRRLWQVPLLLAGVAAFGFGVRALVRTIRPVPFDQQVKGVRGLLEAEQFSKAIEQINILGNYYKQPTEQGELQVLAGDAHYLAQRRLPALVRINYERVEDHYGKAVAWGVVPTVEMNERWGEAAMALGDAKLAVEKLEAAMADAAAQSQGDDLLVQRHGKELVAAYMDAGDHDKALAMVDQLLKGQKAAAEGLEDLAAVDERTWGLCKRIEIALAARGAQGNEAMLKRALDGAREALTGLKERDPAGRILVWLGRAELDRGDLAAAERDLADARKHFAVHHLDDGRAAVMLGNLAEARGELDRAAALFQAVVTAHAGTSIWPAARLGRAEVALLKGGQAGEQVLGDYRYAIDAVKTDGAPPAVGQAPEMISKEKVLASLVKSYQRASEAGHLEDALNFLKLHADMGDRETVDMAYRLATTRERRGAEIAREAAKLEGADKAQRESDARAMFTLAADDYLRHAKLTTLSDDLSGASSWKAAELLDRAGETMRAVALYERLTIQRPRDPRVAEGMLALGRLYESAGMPDKAVEVYQRNIKDYAKTSPAYTSAVNLARCYAELADKAAAPEEKKALFDDAESTLLALVQDNSDLEPAAREFRESLMALGELYYRDRRWSDAMLRLDEVVKRYPNDAGLPRALFLLAESYRKSAIDIAEAIKADAGISGRAELESSRAERLLQAAQDLTRVIGLLDAQVQAAGDASPRKLTLLDEQYLRTSYMDRAECYFERGEYESAIKLYDQAAARFSEETTAVDAYVQIVNAYLALKQPVKAGAAAERGRWILQRVPDAAFAAAASGATRQHYENLLNLSGQ